MKLNATGMGAAGENVLEAGWLGAEEGRSNWVLPFALVWSVFGIMCSPFGRAFRACGRVVFGVAGFGFIACVEGIAAVVLAGRGIP